MGKIDIAICLKRRKKDEKNIKKNIAKQKSLNIIMNKKVFNCNFNSYTNKIVFLIMI